MGDNSRPQATGYPYPPPAPAAAAAAAAAQPVYNYSYNPSYPNTNPQATVLRRLLGILIASIIILGTVVFIIWLVLRPRLPDFRVDSLSLSNLNISSSPSLVSGNWDVRLTARNPNSKIRLYYERIDASVFYRDMPVAYTTLPPLVQGRKNQTALRATFAVAGGYVDRWVADDISRDMSRGKVDFNVRLAAVVRFKAGFWQARRRWVRVYCGDLVVGLAAVARNGTLASGGERGCRVGL